MGSGPTDFERVYEDHIWIVYGYIGYRVRRREEVEDLTQLTFENALRAWGRFDPTRASEATWLLAIARNAVIDHFRRRRESISIDDPESSVPLPTDERSDPARSLGVAPELDAALRRLSGRDREIIALRFGGDLKGREIAEMTGLSLANVQQILSRALRQLRCELEE